MTKNVVLINGSPKIFKNCSGYLLNEVFNELDLKYTVIDIKVQEETFTIEEKYDLIEQSDIIVMAMPLYSGGVPAKVSEFLEGLEEYLNKVNEKERLIYVIVNCGNLNGESTKYALKGMELFSLKCKSIIYAGGIGIGGGQYLSLKRKLPWTHRYKKDIKEKLEIFIGAIKEEKILSRNLYTQINISAMYSGLVANVIWGKMYMKNKFRS